MSKPEKLVKFARKHLGKPYKYGAKLSEAPKMFDCSSFVQYLFKRIDINLPRTALDQASKGKRINLPKDKLQPGDLLFIKGGWGHYNPEFPMGIGHVGVYVGDGNVISARWRKNGKGAVIEEKVEDYLYRPDFVVAKRVL